MAAIKLFTMMGEHAFRRTGTTRHGPIDLCRIDGIAHAVNHNCLILYLRMSVNNFANELQVRVKGGFRSPRLRLQIVLPPQHDKDRAGPSDAGGNKEGWPFFGNLIARPFRRRIYAKRGEEVKHYRA